MTRPRHDQQAAEVPRPDQATRSASSREHFKALILDEAAAIFAADGFAETSLAEVARAVGLSRSALYTYIPSKQALLAELAEGVTKRLVDELETVDGSRGPALDRLRQAIRAIVLIRCEMPARFRLLDQSEGSLPPELAKQHRAWKHRVLDLLVGMLDDGLSDGTMRVVDSRTTALAIIGSCNWVSWWYRPDRDPGPEHVAETIAAMVLRGLEDDAARDEAQGTATGLAHRIVQDVRLLAARAGLDERSTPREPVGERGTDA
jgi:AcrR family transcriptional regulator